MIHLNADVTCRTLAVERRDLYVAIVLQRAVNATAQMSLRNLRQGGETGLEVLLLTFHLVLEVASQRLVAQCRDEDSLRQYRGIR